MSATYTRPTPEQQAEAIRTLAAAMHRQGIDVEAATGYVLAVLDTSARTVNKWAAETVADEFYRRTIGATR